MISLAQTAMLLDRLAVGLRAEVTEDEVDVWHRMISPYEIDAALLAVDEILMTSTFFPKPAEFLTVLNAKRRDVEMDRRERELRTSSACEFCHGTLYGPGPAIVKQNMRYETVKPCSVCAPSLHARAVDNAARSRIAAKKLPGPDTLYEGNPRDGTTRAREVLAAIPDQLERARR